jgi:hypothetical protein
VPVKRTHTLRGCLDTFVAVESTDISSGALLCNKRADAPKQRQQGRHNAPMRVRPAGCALTHPSCSLPLTSAAHSCLQDDVPPFPDEVAFTIIQEQLGRPLEAVFSSISEQPVAAASLGQVRV